MDVDQLLSRELVETFTVEGRAPSIDAAHRQAWLALENSLEAQDVNWVLKGMQHVHDPMNTYKQEVAFKAEFVRKPDES